MIKMVVIGILVIVALIIIVMFGKEVIAYIYCVQAGNENCSMTLLSKVSRLFFK